MTDRAQEKNSRSPYFCHRVSRGRHALSEGKFDCWKGDRVFPALLLSPAVSLVLSMDLSVMGLAGLGWHISLLSPSQFSSMS